MKRETKRIITPIGKHEVDVASYLTGRDKLEIAKESFMSVGVIKALVVSVDGSKENPLEKVLDMHGADFDFVVDFCVKITGESSWQEEKKS